MLVKPKDVTVQEPKPKDGEPKPKDVTSQEPKPKDGITQHPKPKDGASTSRPFTKTLTLSPETSGMHRVALDLPPDVTFLRATLVVPKQPTEGLHQPKRHAVKRVTFLSGYQIMDVLTPLHFVEREVPENPERLAIELPFGVNGVYVNSPWVLAELIVDWDDEKDLHGRSVPGKDLHGRSVPGKDLLHGRSGLGENLPSTLTYEWSPHALRFTRPVVQHRDARVHLHSKSARLEVPGMYGVTTSATVECPALRTLRIRTDCYEVECMADVAKGRHTFAFRTCGGVFPNLWVSRLFLDYELESEEDVGSHLHIACTSQNNLGYCAYDAPVMMISA